MIKFGTHGLSEAQFFHTSFKTGVFLKQFCVCKCLMASVFFVDALSKAWLAQVTTQKGTLSRGWHGHVTSSLNVLKDVRTAMTAEVLRQSSWHDDVTKWNHFPRYWPFVRGIHRSPVNLPSQRTVTQSFVVFFDPRLNKRLSEQWRRRWFETPLRSLWRYCN